MLMGLLLTGQLLILTAPTAAQHPCDQPVADTGTVASTTPVRAQWCQRLDANIDAVTVYTDGQATNLATLTLVTPQPNAAGEVLYEVALGTFAPGRYSIQISNWNKNPVDGGAQESVKSLPFVLTSVFPTPVPGAPRIVRIGS